MWAYLSSSLSPAVSPGDTALRRKVVAYNAELVEAKRAPLDVEAEVARRGSVAEVEKTLFPFPACDDDEAMGEDEPRHATFTFKAFCNAPQSMAKPSMWSRAQRWYTKHFSEFGETHVGLQIGSKTVHYFSHSMVEMKPWKTSQSQLFVVGLDDSGQLANTKANRRRIAETIVAWNEGRKYDARNHNCQDFVAAVCGALGTTIGGESQLAQYVAYVRGLGVEEEATRRLVDKTEADGVMRFKGTRCEWRSHPELDEWLRAHPTYRDMADDCQMMLKAFCRGWQMQELQERATEPASCPHFSITFTTERAADDEAQKKRLEEYAASRFALYRFPFQRDRETRAGAGTGGIRVLALDGGGMRGVVALARLMALEEQKQQQAFEMFDVIAGTSTGSIIALCLTHLRMPAGKIMELYHRVGLELFGDGLSSKVAHYVTKGSLAKSLTEAVEGLVDDRPLAEVGYPKAVAVACKTNNQPMLLCNYDRSGLVVPSRSGFDIGQDSWKMEGVSMLEAVSASAAVPLLLPEVRMGEELLRDGGLVANNPTAIALDEAEALFPGREIELVVSLGTGHCAKAPEAHQSLAGLASQILDQATNTVVADTQLRSRFADRPGVYYRFQTELQESVAISEVRPEVIEALVQRVNDELKKEHNEAWIRLVRKL